MLTKSLKTGTYKITAYVEFYSSAKVDPKELLLSFSRCSSKVVRPKFTG